MYSAASELGVDKYLCLGDLCNYYTDNDKVVDFIIEKKIQCLLGNHDEFYAYGHHLNEQKLKAYNFDEKFADLQEYQTFLRSLPRAIVDEGIKRILFCHGSPLNLTSGYVYPDTDLAPFSDCEFDIVFFGHTHRQFLKTYCGKVFCNVGSVGMPRDNGLLFGFAIYDSITSEISLYRKVAERDRLIERYRDLVPMEVIDLLDRNEIINFPYILLK